MANQYAPFKFDIYLNLGQMVSSQAIGVYNVLTLFYGDKYDVARPEQGWINDLQYNTPLCYLRNTRVYKC
jgi:hypothetical protein